jgi:hypothetical protein
MGKLGSYPACPDSRKKPDLRAIRHIDRSIERPRATGAIRPRGRPHPPSIRLTTPASTTRAASAPAKASWTAFRYCRRSPEWAPAGLPGTFLGRGVSPPASPIPLRHPSHREWHRRPVPKTRAGAIRVLKRQPLRLDPPGNAPPRPGGRSDGASTAAPAGQGAPAPGGALGPGSAGRGSCPVPLAQPKSAKNREISEFGARFVENLALLV